MCIRGPRKPPQHAIAKRIRAIADSGKAVSEKFAPQPFPTRGVSYETLRAKYGVIAAHMHTAERAVVELWRRGRRPKHIRRSRHSLCVWLKSSGEAPLLFRDFDHVSWMLNPHNGFLLSIRCRRIRSRQVEVRIKFSSTPYGSSLTYLF